MDIFDYEISESPIKLPTFKQWCNKSKSLKKPQLLQRVVKLWMPNKYPNYTFETEKFRFQLYENSPLFLPFTKRLEVLIDSEVCLAIRVLSLQEQTAKLDQLENEHAHWSPLGQSGYSLSVMPRK